MWEYRGQKRPPFALEPGPGQESVWDYPRPPALQPDGRHVEVRFGDVILADSRRTQRVLETASPPTFYIPSEDVHIELLTPSAGTSFCEWKGAARYWGLKIEGSSGEAVGWSYPQPTAPFAPIAGYFSFYPARVECYVDEERVRPQEGGFYGGWVTRAIVGPFKGAPGTSSW